MNVSVTSGNDSVNFSQTIFFDEENLQTFTIPDLLAAIVGQTQTQNKHKIHMFVPGVVAGGHGAGGRHQHAADLLHPAAAGPHLPGPAGGAGLLPLHRQHGHHQLHPHQHPAHRYPRLPCHVPPPPPRPLQ